MGSTSAFFATLVVLGAASSVAAHGGGLNAEGCHHDRKNGGYHCHRAAAAGVRRSTPSAGFTSGRVYPNCAAAHAAGAAPIRRGEFGYGAHLDRDNDGIACEVGNGGGSASPVPVGPWRAISAPTSMPLVGNPIRPSQGLAIRDRALDGLSPAEQGTLTRRIQQILDEEGYEPGPIDGHMGAQTRAALTRFQTAMAFPPTGDVDSRTLDALGLLSTSPAIDLPASFPAAEDPALARP